MNSPQPERSSSSFTPDLTWAQKRIPAELHGDLPEPLILGGEALPAVSSTTIRLVPAELAKLLNDAFLQEPAMLALYAAHGLRTAPEVSRPTAFFHIVMPDDRQVVCAAVRCQAVRSFLSELQRALGTDIHLAKKTEEQLQRAVASGAVTLIPVRGDPDLVSSLSLKEFVAGLEARGHPKTLRVYHCDAAGRSERDAFERVSTAALLTADLQGARTPPEALLAVWEKIRPRLLKISTDVISPDAADRLMSLSREKQARLFSEVFRGDCPEIRNAMPIVVPEHACTYASPQQIADLAISGKQRTPDSAYFKLEWRFRMLSWPEGSLDCAARMHTKVDDNVKHLPSSVVNFDIRHKGASASFVLLSDRIDSAQVQRLIAAGAQVLQMPSGECVISEADRAATVNRRVQLGHTNRALTELKGRIASGDVSHPNPGQIDKEIRQNEAAIESIKILMPLMHFPCLPGECGPGGTRSDFWNVVDRLRLEKTLVPVRAVEVRHALPCLLALPFQEDVSDGRPDSPTINVSRIGDQLFVKVREGQSRASRLLLFGVNSTSGVITDCSELDHADSKRPVIRDVGVSDSSARILVHAVLGTGSRRLLSDLIHATLPNFKAGAVPSNFQPDEASLDRWVSRYRSFWIDRHTAPSASDLARGRTAFGSDLEYSVGEYVQSSFDRRNYFTGESVDPSEPQFPWLHEGPDFPVRCATRITNLGSSAAQGLRFDISRLWNVPDLAQSLWGVTLSETIGILPDGGIAGMTAMACAGNGTTLPLAVPTLSADETRLFMGYIGRELERAEASLRADLARASRDT